MQFRRAALLASPLAVLALAGCGGRLAAPIAPRRAAPRTPSAASVPAPASTFALPELVARLTPTVVAVRAVRVTIPASLLDRLAEARGSARMLLALAAPLASVLALAPRPQVTTSSGSGVLVDHAGFVATAMHLVHGATAIVVRTSDGVDRAAALVGEDPPTDLALLRVAGAGGASFPAAALAPPGTLAVGDRVLVAGSPYGLDATFSLGLASAEGRSLGLGPFDEYLQIDARLSLACAGSPVFDLAGRLVGLTTATLAHARGISFAVPSEEILAALPQLARTGHVRRGDLGVALQEMTPRLARALGLPPAGALVADVHRDGPAAIAGVAPGDVIVAFDGAPVASSSALARTIARSQPDRTITLTVYRGRRLLLLRARVRPRSPDGADLPTPWMRRLGATLRPLREAERARLGIDQGVVVGGIDPDGAAANLLCPGDVIVGSKLGEVRTLDDLADALAPIPPGSAAALRVLRGGADVDVAVPLP